MLIFVIIVLVVILIAVIAAFSRNAPRDSSSRSGGTTFARVYPYGFWSVCTYTCDASYEDGELVVVDIKGQLYPGRIVELTNRWPEDIPRNIQLKPIIRRLKASDKGKLAYWSEQLDGFF